MNSKTPSVGTSVTKGTRYVDHSLVANFNSDADLASRAAIEKPPSNSQSWQVWFLLIPTVVILSGIAHLYYQYQQGANFEEISIGDKTRELISTANIHKAEWGRKVIPPLLEAEKACKLGTKCASHKFELANFSRRIGLIYHRFQRKVDCQVQVMRSSSYIGTDSNTQGLYGYAFEALGEMGEVWVSDAVRKPDVQRNTEAELEVFFQAYSNNKPLRKKVKMATDLATKVLNSSCPHVTDGEREFHAGGGQ